MKALVKIQLLTLSGLALFTASSSAVNFTFSISEGTQPANVGTITLTQINATTVGVLFDLSDTSLPAPQYGFLNTGGPHTPFAFTISGNTASVTANFSQPAGGIFNGDKVFSLNLLGGGNTPYGTFGIAIDSSAGNGSGVNNAYYGDLQFQLVRPSGLLTTDFIANADDVFFSADLTNGQNTGAQAFKVRTPSTSVPDGGSSVALLGLALTGLGAFGNLWKKS